MKNGGVEIVPAVLESAEAARYLGVSKTTLYDYVAHGLLDVVRLPKRSGDRKRADAIDEPRRKIQFRRQDLDAFIERQIQPHKEATAVATGTRLPRDKNQFQPGWWKSETH